MRLLIFLAVVLTATPSFATRLNDVTSVFSGNVVAGDPTVVQMADGTFRMSYTDTDLDPLSNAMIATATSPDGLTWAPLSTPDPDPGITVRGRAQFNGEEAVETSAIVQTGPQDWLMYATTYYTPVGDYTLPGYFIPAEMYLLVSEDGGETYDWFPTPVIPNAPGWYTNDGAYSPSIIYTDRFLMAYNAFCYGVVGNCSGIPEAGSFIMTAESFDGVNWTLHPDPVLGPGGSEGPPWMYQGVEDPSLVFHNGQYLLFFGGDNLLDTTAIGMAYADDLAGPWTIVEEPIIEPTPGTTYSFETRAPSAMMDGDDVRLWFTGAQNSNVFSIHHGRAPLSELMGTTPPCTCP